MDLNLKNLFARAIIICLCYTLILATIINVKGADYRCIIYGIIKSDEYAV